MGKASREGYIAAPKEHRSYCLFFLGQNILWTFIGFISTFLTDIGIPAARAAAILLVPKIWDAVNDTIFGYIVDRHNFKNGQKFMPWVRIGTAAVGITTVAIFVIPPSLSEAVKVVWFIIAYMLFDVAYTILDAPAFAVTTVMTSNVQERTSIIAGGKLWSMVGAMFATIMIPMVRPVLGWATSSIVFIVVSVILMIPMLINVKERHSETVKAEETPSFKEMLVYLKNNKYLLFVLLALLVLGLSSVEQILSIYLARICFGKESVATIVSACVAVSVIFSSAIIPKLAKKFDKFQVLRFGLAFSLVANILTYFIGYKNLPVAIVFIMLKCVGLAFYQVIIYMLIADTVEYGTYKTGTRAAGISFSLQCFTAKMKNALVNSVALGALAIFGFVEGENAIQPAGVDQGVWKVFCLLPAIGFTLALIELSLAYKLRDKDVQVMSKFNNGEITKDEAEAVLKSRFGSAHN